MDTALVIQPLAPSDWLAITSILVDVMAMIVGGFLAIWVVQSIQSKLDAEQKLREYFFSEVLNIRKANREVMQDVYNHCVKARDFTKRMSTINQLTTELMNRLKLKYQVNDQNLLIFQSDLNDKVSNRYEYTAAFRAAPLRAEPSRLRLYLFFRESRWKRSPYSGPIPLQCHRSVLAPACDLPRFCCYFIRPAQRSQRQHRQNHRIS